MMALLVVTLIVLSQEPRVSPSVQPQYACHNSTVELLFDNMPWLDHIAISMEYNCEAELYQIQDEDCRALPTLHTDYTDINDGSDSIYMLPGSVIHFTVHPSGSGQIWIFADYNTFCKFTEDPSLFVNDCHNPPSGADCLLAEEHRGNYPYTITRPAYYFINIDFVNGNITWKYNRTIFDIEAITQKYPNSVTLTQIYKTISFPFPYKKSCILLKVPADMCYRCSEIRVTNAIRQENYLIFPAILLVVCVMILIVLIGVHVYCHSKFSRHCFVWCCS